MSKTLDLLTNPIPYVSIVMPVYNSVGYLHDAIKSVLNQSFADFEYIILDDGSTDNTWEIVTNYAECDRRIIPLRNTKNFGITFTLNKGVSAARGKYIARMDADDIAIVERLAAQVTYLEDHPEVGVLGTAYIRMFTNGKKSLRRPPTTDTAIRWRLLFDNVWCHPSIMFRRDLVAMEQPFYRDYPHAEDYELWTRLLSHTQGATLPLPLLHYRMHENSVSATHKAKQDDITLTIVARQINGLLNATLTLSEIAIIRHCWHLRQPISSQEWMFCTYIFRLFDSFAQQPGIDKLMVNQLQHQWIQRLLAAISPREYGKFWRSELRNLILKHNPAALLVAGSVHLPRRLLRWSLNQAGLLRAKESWLHNE